MAELAVLASIAGVSTAGVAISKMIYEISHAVKHAPREVSDMAGEISLLSSVLRYLRGALVECIDVCKPRLIKDIQRTVSKIHELYRQVKDLAKNSTSSFYRVTLVFKTPRTKNLLAQIEGFKNSVTVMLTTVQLAAAKKQMKVSKEMASKSDVGEIRQLLENLLCANEDAVKRIRRRQSFDMSPQPQNGLRYSSPPRRSSPFTPQVVNWDDGKQTRTKTHAPAFFGPLPSNDHDRLRKSSRQRSKEESNTQRYHADSSTKMHQASFQDFDEEEDDDAHKDQPEHHESSTVGKSPPLAVVPARTQTQNIPSGFVPNPTRKNEKPGTYEVSNDQETNLHPKPPTREDGTGFDGQQKKPARNIGITASYDDYSDWSDHDSDAVEHSSESSETLKDRDVHVGGGYFPYPGGGEQLSNSKGTYDSGSHDPIWKATNVTVGTRGRPVEDAATWLYRLVFLDEDGEGRPARGRRHAPIPQPQVQIPRAADRLLLQWTNTETAADGVNASDGDTTMADPDPSWSRRLRRSISMLETKENGPTRSGRYKNETSDSGIISEIEPGRSRNTDRVPCKHGSTNPFCALCREEMDPWASRNRSRSYNQRPGSNIPPYGMGYGMGPQPNAPYSSYEAPGLERAYLMERNTALLTDLERLETSLRRTEAFHMKETAQRDRIEQQNLMRHEQEIKSLQERMDALKEADMAARVELERRAARAQEELAYFQKTEAMAKMEKANPTRSRLQIATIADREKTWNPRFLSLGLSFSRVDAPPASAHTAIHGTVCWTRPFLPSLSELYQVLKLHEWRPLWMRRSAGGQTWFLGKTPILVNFLQQDYVPQMGPLEDQTASPVHVNGGKDEYAAIVMGLIDRDAIDDLGLPYKGRVDGQYRFGVELTYEDVESLVGKPN